MNGKDKEFMRMAIALSQESVAGGGGPFGAVVVKDGKVVAAASNSVTIDTDPTAHAEVTAIRMAARNLDTFDLAGCSIYTSCEPCPMCLGAIYWAHIDKIYYANDKEDAREIGFDDSFIYDEIALDKESRRLPSERILADEAIEVFKEWENKEDKINY